MLFHLVLNSFFFGFVAINTTMNGTTVQDSIPLLLDKKYTTVGGYKMAYHESGKGPVVMFFHGNPTSSYEWRKIIPRLNHSYKCIAHDRMGMGDSDKIPATVPNRYTYGFQYNMVNNFISQVTNKKEKIFMVAHDWGAVIAIQWARMNPERVKGIAFMETFLEPLESGKSPEFAIQWFKNWRSEEMQMAVTDSNRFVEHVLFGDIGKYLSTEEKETYRKPFINSGDDRLPTLIWPRQVSIDKAPMTTHTVLLENMQFMAWTQIPKLFINAEPGALLSSEARRNVIRKWPNLKEVKVKGAHFIQESSPSEIGLHVKAWIASL